jgi:hypothetical protein
MRHLRWKQKFLSGFVSLDHSKHLLYEDLQALQAEMEHNEHCQDMEDLMDELNKEARSLFEAKAGSCRQAAGLMHKHTGVIEQILDQHLPLAALDTPACRACAVCAHTDVLMHKWLEQSLSLDADEKDHAA